MVSGCVSSPWRHTKWVQIDPFTTVAALTACLAAVVPPGSRLYIEYHGMLLGPHDLEDEDLPAVGSLRAMAVPPAGVSCDSMDWKYLERMEWMQRSDEAQGSDGDAAVSASHESTAGPADGSDEGGRSGSGGGSSGGGSGGGRGGGSRGGGSGSTTAGGVDDEVTVKRPSSAAGSGSDSERSIESINTWHRNLKQHSSSGARYL